MEIINYLIQNWVLVVVVAALIGVCVWSVMQFVHYPPSKQIAKVQEWLLWAVTVAESELGSGTGQLKLRYVYDMFIEKFPALAKTISFEYFSTMVDKALEKMKAILNQNKHVAKLVETGEKTVTVNVEKAMVETVKTETEDQSTEEPTEEESKE